MVKPSEFLALDPDVEDILSMWGKEINSQNVDYYFGSVDSPSLASATQPEILQVLSQVQVPDRELQPEDFTTGPSHQTIETDLRRAYAASKPSEPKGLSLKPRFPNPKGLEEISQLGFPADDEHSRPPGAPGSLTRVSLSRESQGLPEVQPNDQGTSLAVGPAGNDGQGAGTLSAGNVNLVLSGQIPPLWEPDTILGSAQITSDNTEDCEGRRPGGECSRPRGTTRKQKRPIGSQIIAENLVLGMEVSMREAIAVADCTLVGRVRGKPYSSVFLQEWGEKSFTPERPVNFEAQVLAKGWFKFKFEDKDTADWVLQRLWHIDNIPVLFKKWSPLFDAIKERTDSFPVWVRAPGLPSLLWTEEVFRTIGNRLGEYMTADMSFLTTNNLATARFLVMLKPSGGLAQKVNLQFGEYVHEQLLDYEYLPFRCHWCHEHGHLAKDCPHKRRRRHFRRTPAHRANAQSDAHIRMEQDLPEPHEQMNMEAEETEIEPSNTNAKSTNLEAEIGTDQAVVEGAVEVTAKVPEAEKSSAEGTLPILSDDPEKVTSIIRRKAMLKELASCYQAECAYYCQELLELQGKWEQELDASSIGPDGVELLQGHETSNPKYALENEMCLEGAHMPLQKIKQASSTVSTSNEDVGSADVMENSTGASKAPLRRRLSWRANEREALRRGLLMFGLGRSDRVRSVMHSILKQMRHGLGDIADCCWEFVRICGLHADEKERPYAEKLYEKSKDLGIEVGPEVSSRVGPWDRVEKSASGWLKRLVLLDSLGNVIRLCASKETQEAAYNAIDNLKDGTIPFEWWGREADLALLAGVYKHGFGNYEALQGDSQFTSAFRPLHRDNMKMLSEIDNGQHSSEFGDPNFKDRFHIDDDPEHMDMREGHKLYWPDANTLTRRLRRLVEHISRIEKEIDMSGKHIKEKPARIWTKREKMELVKVLMMWGRPLAMGDSSNYHWQLVRNQASIGLLKNRNQSSIENSIKGLEREMLQVLECSDTHQEKEHTSATEPSSPTIVGPKVLSNKNAVRLKERLELVDSLRQAMDSLPEDWGHLGLQLSQRNNMPSWWQAGHHDKELVKGVLAHGFGNWEAIFEDNNLNFRVSDSFSETGNHPDPKDCMKRLRFIGSHLRRRLRKLKARRKRHFFDDKENEISTEPRRFKRSRPNIPRTPDGRPILPLALTERLTIVDLGTIEYKRAGFHTDRHIFPIGYKSIRNYASMVEKDGRTTYTCTILDGGSAGPIFRVVPDDSPEKVIERDSASGAWAVVCGTGNKMRGIERGKITISGTEMFGLSHPTVIQLLRELPGAEYCSTFFSDYPTFGSHSRRQSISTPVIPSVQDGSEFRDTEVKQKPMSSFGDQSEQSLSDSSEETDSSDSSDEVDGSYQGVTSDKMAEDQSFTRRNMLVHSGNRERTYLDINADPEELESP